MSYQGIVVKKYRLTAHTLEHGSERGDGGRERCLIMWTHMYLLELFHSPPPSTLANVDLLAINLYDPYPLTHPPTLNRGECGLGPWAQVGLCFKYGAASQNHV